MANDLNQVRIDGRLVEAPKIKQLDSGARVATIRIANNRYYKGKDEPEWKERNGYFDVQAWNALADSVPDMSKGQPVHIEGALGQDQWTDAEGKQHSRILIEASNIEAREVKQGERPRRGAKSARIRRGAIARFVESRKRVFRQSGVLCVLSEGPAQSLMELE